MTKGQAQETTRVPVAPVRVGRCRKESVVTRCTLKVRPPGEGPKP